MYSDIKQNINFSKLSKVVVRVSQSPSLKGGGGCNFIKEKYFNMTIPKVSQGFKFVNEKSHDFESPIGNIEAKSQASLTHTSGGKYSSPKIREKCANFTLKNKHTKNTIGLNKNFEHLLLMQTKDQFVFGLVPYDIVLKYTHDEGDKWVVKGLPVSEIDILYSENIKFKNAKPFLSIDHHIDKEINDTINEPVLL